MVVKDIYEFVKKINTDLGSFCNEFQYKRKELLGAGRTAGNNELFGNVNSNGWAINKGGGIEVQYHLNFDEEELVIKYGLGFNTQYVQFANAMSMVQYTKPYMDAFLQLESKIQDQLPDYSFIVGDRSRLESPQNNQYTLFGKVIPIVVNEDSYVVDDNDYLIMMSDFKKQFNPYIQIFELRNKLITMNNEINNVIDLLKYKKQIILQGPPGTGKTRKAKEIANVLCAVNEITEEDINAVIEVGTIAKTPTQYNTFEVIEKGNGFLKVTPKGAQNNYTVSFQEIIDSYKNKHWDGQVSANNTNGNASYKIGIAKYIYDNLKKENYKLIQFHPAYSYEDFVRGITAKLKGTQVEYKAENKVLAEFAKNALDNKELNYVLIIDEINRANLPAVLGELIYALEYRYDQNNIKETTVESMYEIDGDRRLTLPPNLFIVGTMNTADRSVGHIDYAIRRRFAFVDVLPTMEPIREAGKELFKKVSSLFIENFDTLNWADPKLIRSKHLAADFRPEDIWLGHSYFLTKEKDENGNLLDEAEQIKIKLKYEIVPILKEYLKDGILNESAKGEIESLC